MSFANDIYYVDKDPYEWCLRQSKRLKAIDPPMNIQMRNHKILTQLPGELEHAVKCRCNQNCTLDDISNTLQDIRKRTNIGKFTPSPGRILGQLSAIEFTLHRGFACLHAHTALQMRLRHCPPISVLTTPYAFTPLPLPSLCSHGALPTCLQHR
ncbi:hypothetical protein O181_021067 [Austropuccinia psidii MF-1]|uniref:Uncharacterized protein n=1 Tax=Austropuccinia psidii MF-1 TaxID=1389203 RepID=A0A9Q3CES2_9BASI|nr:hypothetical protein [Austropuccinia psidii MF-1]